MLFRKETRWPGYLYRPDYATLDDDNWKVFVNSRYDAPSGAWQMSKKPLIQVIDWPVFTKNQGFLRYTSQAARTTGAIDRLTAFGNPVKSNMTPGTRNGGK